MDSHLKLLPSAIESFYICLEFTAQWVLRFFPFHFTLRIPCYSLLFDVHSLMVILGQCQEVTDNLQSLVLTTERISQNVYGIFENCFISFINNSNDN